MVTGMPCRVHTRLLPFMQAAMGISDCHPHRPCRLVHACSWLAVGPFSHASSAALERPRPEQQCSPSILGAHATQSKGMIKLCWSPRLTPWGPSMLDGCC